LESDSCRNNHQPQNRARGGGRYRRSRRQPPAGRGGCDKLRRAAQRRKAWWRLPAPRALVRPLLTRDISRRVSPRAPRQTAPVVRRRSEVHHVVRRIHHLHHRAAAFRPSRSSRECCPADKISRRGFSPCSSAAECRAETRGTPNALPRDQAAVPSCAASCSFHSVK
jgi:hypothetical protein